MSSSWELSADIIAELQKCANHPYLFQNAEPDIESPEEAAKAMIEASGKMQLLDKMLTQLKATGTPLLKSGMRTETQKTSQGFAFFLQVCP